MNNSIPLPAIETIVKHYSTCQKHVSNGNYRGALPYAWSILEMIEKYSIYIDINVLSQVAKMRDEFINKYDKIIYIDTYWKLKDENFEVIAEIMELYCEFLYYTMMAIVDLGVFEHEVTGEFINLFELQDRNIDKKIKILRVKIKTLGQENKELKDKLNTIMEQLEQLNNTFNGTAPEPQQEPQQGQQTQPEPQQEPQQGQQTQPEPTPINKDNKEVDKKTSIKYKIIYLINSGKNTNKELRESIGVNINLFYECLREMLRDGVLNEHTEGRKKYYEIVR